jgi:HAD superfamily hydrolase (TIGR01509 family)
MDNTLLKLNVDWERLAHEFNKKYFKNKYAHLSPTQLFVTYFPIILDKVPEKQRKEIIKNRVKAELAGIPKTICFPYKNVLRNLNKKYKLGIVSGNFRITIKRALKKCGIDKYINEIVGIDDVPISKPSPIPIFVILKKLRCEPQCAVYVGDHPDDIRAGKTAGTKTIAVKHSKHYNEFKKSIRPDAFISTLFELEEILREIDK